MAIQVGGTTVINNSRQLQNVASIDTTTKNAISSAGVGGLTTATTSSASAFSYTGSNYFGSGDTGTISSSQPNSNIVYASKTISSGVALASVVTTTAASGITTYSSAQGYYGVTVGLMHWDGTSLYMLARAFDGDSLSTNPLLNLIQGKSASSGIIAVSPGDVLYACIISSYSNYSFTGGASWAAGTVTTEFLEVS